MLLVFKYSSRLPNLPLPLVTEKLFKSSIRSTNFSSDKLVIIFLELFEILSKKGLFLKSTISCFVNFEYMPLMNQGGKRCQGYLGFLLVDWQLHHRLEMP